MEHVVNKHIKKEGTTQVLGKTKPVQMPHCPHQIPYALAWESNPDVGGKKPAINKVRLKKSRSYRTENAAYILYEDQPVNVLRAYNNSLFLDSHDAYK